ncbi:HD domain-containing protein [Endozoicomonas sp. G2_1]|uniref:HD domain-containing protein n=1 Tax=Endozoicomonas sp. G2_1 TaxID=2821091 RepID=UPI001ADA726B|nr:HD domain-containing protein [Endozoicomonas sp. G2_1]MBO9489786.1 HD domain-containing protein [Endozoicomonas sp. G2_1]
MRKYLLNTLLDLEFVEQNPTYHPEGNALFHSLQVFQLSLKFSNDPEIWAAALFHDIGKAIDGPTHAEIGAELLSGIFNENICWLIRHHLDLLTHPAKTKRALRNSSRLKQLIVLRHLDLNGRDPYGVVCTPEFAVDYILQHFSSIKA